MMTQTNEEQAPYFEVAEGFVLLEAFDFPLTVTSSDPTYLKHFKMSRSLKNTAYYTVRKHCALTPFGPFVSPAALEALSEEMESVYEAVTRFNGMSATLNLDLNCEVNLVHARVSDQETWRQKLRRGTIDALSRMKADLLEGKLNQLTHKASPYNNLDAYCKGAHAAMIRAVYDSLKDQIATLRSEKLRGAGTEAKVDTRVIDEAIDLFRRSM